MNNPEAALIASCAADHLACLEALFDAIREHLEENTYQYSLADLGQSVASHYSADMRRLADAEENRT